jgi:hypothetical protein
MGTPQIAEVLVSSLLHSISVWSSSHKKGTLILELLKYTNMLNHSFVTMLVQL